MYCKNCGSQLDNNNVCNNCEKSIVGIQNQQIQEKVKKKRYWWIPIALFVGGILLKTSALVVKVISLGNNSEDLIVSNKSVAIYDNISLVLNSISNILWLLVIPSIIVAIILNEKTKENK